MTQGTPYPPPGPWSPAGGGPPPGWVQQGQPPGWRQPERPRKGAFKGLFDLGFNHVITPRLVKTLYVTAMMSLVGNWIYWVPGCYLSGEPAWGTFFLVTISILTMFLLMLTRAILEACLAVIRLSERSQHRSA